ncbi:DUF3549 family protein [Cognaticolwellia mytili]|uniref:DUF3549 family protein n=1 Tax=Cognaticolwellia mytili TaxID=1888913 RepID=UPI000A174BDD|nr:DUF3549 family protein [Cognaticolwellia mytili]
MSTTSNHIASISELLNLSGSQYRIYDIGRRVDKISKEQFEKIESAQLPYPFPSQGHAQLAIAFWQKQSTTPYLWFVKLPLDERGLLNQGARNHFIAIIVEALGSDLSVSPTEQQETLLKKNPYHFTPPQYKLAAVNSIISVALKQPASKFYQPAINYLSGINGWDAWHEVGVQGLSDVAIRIDDNSNAEVLTSAFNNLPEQVLSPLCSTLENMVLPAELIEKITQRYVLANSENDTSLALSLLRALASSTQHPYSEKFIVELINSQTLSEDTLIIIAGRLWSILNHEEILFNYLEQLIKSDDLELFKAIFKDLVAIPTTRPLLLQAIRSPNRSSALAHAIGELFKQ